MRILGLDIAGCTGYSLLKEDYLVEYGTVSIKPKDDYRNRLIDLNKKTKRLIKELYPDIVALEELHSTRNAKVTRLLAMYRAAVLLAIPKKILVLDVNANRAKAKVLNLGKRTSKEDVFKWVVKYYDIKGLEFEKDNDITDSILIAKYVLDYC